MVSARPAQRSHTRLRAAVLWEGNHTHLHSRAHIISKHSFLCCTWQERKLSHFLEEKLWVPKCGAYVVSWLSFFMVSSDLFQNTVEFNSSTLRSQTNTAVVRRLKPGIIYVFQVRARTVAGFGRFSGKMYFQTMTEGMPFLYIDLSGFVFFYLWRIVSLILSQ